MFIDLDRFKILNDTKGHEIGDLLLKEVANRLVQCFREEDTVARMGGGEFVIVLEGLSANEADAQQEAMEIGEKVRAAIDKPYSLAGHADDCSPSIGICLFSGKDKSVKELLMQADKAMYQTKAAGRNAVRVYDDKMDDANTEFLTNL